MSFPLYSLHVVFIIFSDSDIKLSNFLTFLLPPAILAFFSSTLLKQSLPKGHWVCDIPKGRFAESAANTPPIKRCAEAEERNTLAMCFSGALVMMNQGLQIVQRSNPWHISAAAWLQTPYTRLSVYRPELPMFTTLCLRQCSCVLCACSWGVCELKEYEARGLGVLHIGTGVTEWPEMFINVHWC